MNAAQAKLKRLQRLERVREIAKRQAAREAAEAESTLSRLVQLSRHADRLVRQYRPETGQSDGHSHREQQTFIRELAGLHASTASDAQRARDFADARQGELAAAEKRRSVVAERVRRTAAGLQRGKTAVPLSARRGFGTEVE